MSFFASPAHVTRTGAGYEHAAVDERSDVSSPATFLYNIKILIVILYL